MEPRMSLSEKFCSHVETNPKEDLAQVFQRLCSDLGFDNITYYSEAVPRGDETDAVLITTYPKAWIDRYFEEEYEAIDPVLRAASRSLLPVDWCELNMTNKTACNFFCEAAEFGVGKSGLTVPVRGVFGEQAMVSLNSNCSASSWKGFCKDSSSDLVYLSHLIHENVMASRVLQKDLSQSHITCREAEVLRWAARGKTAWETARILGLTEKTVSFYIGNACSKLRVATKTQAVAKAVRERLILF